MFLRKNGTVLQNAVRVDNGIVALFALMEHCTGFNAANYRFACD
jgi:hypothetical protein